MKMSNFSKNQKRIIIAAAIIFVVFSVIAFAVPFPKGGVFWVTYLFSVISLAVQPFVMKKAFDGENDINSKLYGFPIARISVVYCIAQTVLSLVFMALGKWLAVWVVVVFDVLLLGAAAVGFIGADAMRDEIVRQDKKLVKNTKYMNDLSSKVNVLVDQCGDEDVRKAVAKLAENIKYSDIVSSEALKDIEADLSSCVDELQGAVVDGEKESALSLTVKAEGLLAERNRLCKLNKK